MKFQLRKWRPDDFFFWLLRSTLKLHENMDICVLNAFYFMLNIVAYSPSPILTAIKTKLVTEFFTISDSARCDKSKSKILLSTFAGLKYESSKSQSPKIAINCKVWITMIPKCCISYLQIWQIRQIFLLQKTGMPSK